MFLENMVNTMAVGALALVLVSEWVIKFNSLSWTADSEVHVVHMISVIIVFTLSSLMEITHNLQAIINFKKKEIKKRTTKKSDIKRPNTLNWLDQYMCTGLRLWNSRDHEAV